MFCGKPIARMYTMPSLRFDYKQKKKNSNSDFVNYGGKIIPNMVRC